jgi:coenzyme F420-reducing hydrogenase delta subunit
MVPRSDGRAYQLEARVDPSKCVGCGICVGACDGGAIDVPILPAIAQRHRLDDWLDAARDAPCVAFLCASAAGAGLTVDAATGRARELPGYVVLPVPCAGWVQPLLVERAFRHGASGVLIVGCAPAEPAYREGARFTRLRLAGERVPALRSARTAPGRVRFLELGRSDRARLRAEARAFRAGDAAPPRPPARRAARIACGLALAGGLGAVTWLASDARYHTPPAAAGPRLVVAFQHPGRAGERCRDVPPEELAKQPVHMRQPRVCERGRLPVRLRVTVDGEVRVARSVPARGLFGDGLSVAMETLPLAPGEHVVRVEIGDSADGGEWQHVSERAFAAAAGERRVVVFDRSDGFVWE